MPIKDTEQQTELETRIHIFASFKKQTLLPNIETILGWKSGKRYSRQMEPRNKQA